MATKILKLKPVQIGIGRVGTYNKATFSVVPSDTAADVYHTLVSESIADNEATYIKIGGGYYIDVKFENLPTNIQIHNVSIKISATASAEDATSADPLTFEFYQTVNNVFELIDTATTTNIITDLLHEYKILVCQSDTFTEALNQNINLNYTFRFQTPQVADAINITQIYAEIQYESLDNTKLYYHDNNKWQLMPCHILQKINGVWQTVNINKLVQNEQFNLTLL